jgi:hypothetical protein
MRALIVLLALTATAFAQRDAKESLDLLSQRGAAIFATEHAAVWPEGVVSILGTPEDAADEAARAVAIDCPALVKQSAPATFVYTVYFSATLTNLDVSWSVGLKPDGEVVYENITPDPAMRAYFTEFAQQLSCAQK